MFEIGDKVGPAYSYFEGSYPAVVTSVCTRTKHVRILFQDGSEGWHDAHRWKLWEPPKKDCKECENNTLCVSCIHQERPSRQDHFSPKKTYQEISVGEALKRMADGETVYYGESKMLYRSDRGGCTDILHRYQSDPRWFMSQYQTFASLVSREGLWYVLEKDGESNA